MKSPGKYVQYIDSAGILRNGLVYNSQQRVNGKTVVHPVSGNWELIKDAIPVLVDEKKLIVRGFKD